ncbi:MAG: SMC-Scp complex subunit ScpB [Candidatus Moranbacteria bacterium]|jgi:segregation and condensation protein B|nr:SMC-Scp complex subunit ScpB [Candidatus Moranbacteria bacterium]MDD5652344.1 SMC-Scp complex subunit ScpB [Candidatus Moranbacteria bacterium]MDX9855748.1 SMC-Scp complex subunit ScpB [Candidatus Moranbacteria bacterium]
MEKEKTKSIVESLLFSKGTPINFSQLAKALEISKEKIKEAIEGLSEDYTAEGRGIVLIISGNSVQLATNPENASYVEKIIKRDLQDSLSKAALEVVSIIAYRGPISRLDIEAIRGVNSSFTLRNLLMRGMIVRAVNKKDQRGYLYKVSFEFIKKLGLTNLKDLPDYEKLSHDGRIGSIINIRTEK